MAKDQSTCPGDELASFEGSLQELEQIVRELESGNIPLSESLKKYESGIKNLKICHQILEQAENRIRVLTGIAENGDSTTTEFDAQETELNQRGKNRSVQRTDSHSAEGRELDGRKEGPEGNGDHDEVVDDSSSLF